MTRAVRFAVPVAVVSFASPSAADAADIATPSCVRYVAGAKTFAIQGTGFARDALVEIAGDGRPIGSASADAAGNFSEALFAPVPSFSRNQQTFQITADDGQGQTAGPVSVPVTRVTVKMPSRARPHRRVRYRVFGFTPDQRVYLHVRRRDRTLGRFALGKATGPCGNLIARKRFMPLRRYSTGTYQYHFQHSRRFRREETVVRLKIVITRTFVRR